MLTATLTRAWLLKASAVVTACDTASCASCAVAYCMSSLLLLLLPSCVPGPSLLRPAAAGAGAAAVSEPDGGGARDEASGDIPSDSSIRPSTSCTCRCSSVHCSNSTDDPCLLLLRLDRPDRIVVTPSAVFVATRPAAAGQPMAAGASSAAANAAAFCRRAEHTGQLQVQIIAHVTALCGCRNGLWHRSVTGQLPELNRSQEHGGLDRPGAVLGGDGRDVHAAPAAVLLRAGKPHKVFVWLPLPLREYPRRLAAMLLLLLLLLQCMRRKNLPCSRLSPCSSSYCSAWIRPQLQPLCCSKRGVLRAACAFTPPSYRDKVLTPLSLIRVLQARKPHAFKHGLLLLLRLCPGDRASALFDGSGSAHCCPSPNHHPKYCCYLKLQSLILTRSYFPCWLPPLLN